MQVKKSLRVVLPLAWALSSSLAVAADAAKPARPSPAAAPSPAKPAVKPPPKVLVIKATKTAPLPEPPAASAEQLEAAKLVYTGTSECEFKQSIRIDDSDKYPGYLVLHWQKAAYTMKPVLSTTGAMRLEDVTGQTLLIQIGNKSMLMNVKAGQRLVDDCIHPRQREAIEAARANPTPPTALLVPPLVN